jgi:hypothetical protein
MNPEQAGSCERIFLFLSITTNNSSNNGMVIIKHIRARTSPNLGAIPGEMREITGVILGLPL